MGDQQHGLPALRAQLQQQALHTSARQCVQRGKGFIQQQKARPQGKGAGQRRPLPHAAGQGRRQGRRLFGKAHGVQQPRHPLAPFGGGQPAGPQAEGHVFRHREPGEKRIFLKKQQSFRTGPGAGTAVQQDGPAVRRQQARQQTQQRALAAAALPDEDRQAARRKVKIRRRQHRLPVEGLVKGAADQERHQRTIPGRRRSSRTSALSQATPRQAMQPMPQSSRSACPFMRASMMRAPSPSGTPVSSPSTR